MKRYEIETYVNEAGESPVQEWLEQLKDKTARTKLYARIDRSSFGNFGDWKSLQGVKEIFEMREHHG